MARAHVMLQPLVAGRSDGGFDFGRADEVGAGVVKFLVPLVSLLVRSGCRGAVELTWAFGDFWPFEKCGWHR
jgi:hypothetical protein